MTCGDQFTDTEARARGDSLMKPYYEDPSGIVIYHGDCRDVLPSLRAVDLLFTSPPYAQQREYTLPIDDWDALMIGAFGALQQCDTAQVCVNLGLIYRDGEIVTYWSLWLDYMRRRGWRLFGWYVWDKGFGLPGDWQGRFGPSHEWVFHFNKRPREVNKVIECRQAGQDKGGSGLRRADGTMSGLSKPGPINPHKIPDSVIRVWPEQSRGGPDANHPARFPEELPALVIAALSDAAGLVVDPFMGSGTTLVAAKRMGRKAIGIEIEERYCEIAAKRLAQGALPLEMGA